MASLLTAGFDEEKSELRELKKPLDFGWSCGYRAVLAVSVFMVPEFFWACGYWVELAVSVFMVPEFVWACGYRAELAVSVFMAG